MPIITPDYFRHEDLYISASLQAVVDGKQYDLTGRRYFNAEIFGAEGAEVQTSKHMAQGIGFGITDINIDISTSLQPIIEITFKDLYGNTMFGGNNPQGIDYSVFFAWPPPKFKFTFKGYLGRQVTYMLSLKKYDISFNSNDASYSIKGIFVPHQWGFFADLPFYFILAAKALKKQAGIINEDDTENVLLDDEYKSSVQDIIEIGAEVDAETFLISSEFEDVTKLLSDLKSNPVEFLQSSYGFDKISGSVDGEQIKGFVSIQLDEGKIGLVGDEVYKKGNTPGLRDYVLSKVLLNVDDSGKGEKGPFFKHELKDFDNDAISNDNKKAIRDRVLKVIRENLDEIQKDISAKRFAATVVKLQKLTISRVLNQLASDSAYVMGRILEAGLKGFEENREARNEAVEQDNLIAHHYPLIIDDEGKEVPAENVGIEDSGNELDFVRIFTEAVTKGVVDFQNVVSINPEGVTSEVSHPISTMEIFAPKPYAGIKFTKWGTDILGRSAIAAWFTKNSDITDVGDANPTTIEELAETDFRNISKADLRRLPEYERNELRIFCEFWKNLINKTGTNFLAPNGQVDEEGYNLEDYLKPNKNNPVDKAILDYKVVVEYGGKATEVKKLSSQKALVEFIEDNSEVITRTVKDMLNPLFVGDLASINPEKMAGSHFMNNGVPYFTLRRTRNKFYIAFKGEHAKEAQKKLQGKEGVVYMDKFLDDEAEGLTDEVIDFNSRVRSEWVLDYEKLLSKDDNNVLNEDLRDFNSEEWLDSYESRKKFLMTDQIKTPDSEGIDVRVTPILYVEAFFLQGVLETLEDDSDLPNDHIAFDLFTGTITGFFTDDGPILGQYQRQYIRLMCVKILDLLFAMESDDNRFISQVIGSAQEGEDIIYKQFHSLFQQWNTIAFKDDVDPTGSIVNSSAPGYRDLAEDLMHEYGSCGFDNGINTIDGDFVEKAKASDKVTSRSGVFVYDFPLQRIKQAGESNPKSSVRVENSLINTDALREVKSDTTVLNVIQTICDKNNFMFIPIPGYTNYLDINDIYTPKNFDGHQRVINFFHVMFIPTPESRALKPSDSYATPAALGRSQEDLDVDALEVKYGSTENNVVRNVSVSTQDNKVTAESAINLERLVNNENNNKTVTTDCSMLNVMAGRSYTATIDILGNAQVFPMQFFFIRNLPMFDGLYQILNVKHTITPNNFETSMEGIRMRFFSASDYGGIFPITIDTLAKNAEERGVDIPDYLRPEGSDLNIINPHGGTEADKNQAFENVIEEYESRLNIS